MKTGDQVTLTVGGHTVTATVMLASQNGRSLFLSFEAVVAGHVGGMPVLQDDSGVYRAVVTGDEVRLEPRHT